MQGLVGNRRSASELRQMIRSLGTMAAFSHSRISGRSYPVSTLIGVPTTSVVVVGSVLYVSWFNPDTYTYDRLGVRVTGTAGGGQSLRMAIYNDEKGEPGNLILETDTILVSTTGFKNAVIDVLLHPGWYWLAFQTDSATAVLNVVPNASVLSMIGFESFATFRPTAVTEVQAYGAFPDPAVPAALTNAVVPLMFMRVD